MIVWQLDLQLSVQSVHITTKTDRHDITEISLQVALNTITLSQAKPNRILELEGMELSIKNITLHISYIVRWFIEGLPRTVASC